MRSKIFIAVILIAAAGLTATVINVFRTKDYVEVPYEVTNDVSKNLKVLVNIESLNDGYLRLKFIPKRDKVNVAKMEIWFEDKILLTFSDLDGKLDFTNREPKMIQVNAPFPAGRINFKKLSIHSIEGTLPKS